MDAPTGPSANPPMLSTGAGAPTGGMGPRGISITGAGAVLWGARVGRGDGARPGACDPAGADSFAGRVEVFSTAGAGAGAGPEASSRVEGVGAGA